MLFVVEVCGVTMPRSKELSEAFRKKVIDAYESGKGFKKISKQFEINHSTVRKIIYKWRRFQTTANLFRPGRPSKFSPRADRKMLKEVSKNPRMSSRDLQVALATVDVKVHESTIRKRLHKFDLHGRCARRKPLLSRKNIRARLKFANEHLGKDQHFWNNVLWTDESKVELFGHSTRRHVWRKPKTAFDHKNLIPTVKHGGGNIMVWGSFAASGPGQLTIIESTMNSSLYQRVLEDNVRPSVGKLKLNRKWTLQHDNDPKHASKSTKEWLKRKKWKVLEWPSQSPDLNPIEMLWGDLKRAVHARNPSNIAQLKEFCMEEWANISPSRCQRLVDSYKKRLLEVVSAKGGNTTY